MRIYRPKWRDLTGVLAECKQYAILCSPYITTSGVNTAFDALPPNIALEVFTRLSPSDWASKASDPEALLALLDLWRNAGNESVLRIVQRLHAKVYSADGARTIIGSANLTEGGFGRNIELVVELEAAESRDALQRLREECAEISIEVSIDALASWIDESRESVLRARASASNEADLLASAQERLDKALGLVKAADAVAAPPEIAEFVSFLERSRQLAGADIVITRFKNADGHNLTGHVKQCYASTFRFLSTHSEFLAPLTSDLDRLEPDEVCRLTVDGLLDAWTRHLDNHARDVGDSYSYPTLRGLLPASLGGTRRGGGGGSGTLRRVMPLVARWMTATES